MTAEHKRMSEEAHSLALALYRHLVYGELFDGAGGEPVKQAKRKREIINEE